MEMNDQIENQSGYKYDEIINQNINILFPKIISDNFESTMQKIYNKGDIPFSDQFLIFFIRNKSVNIYLQY